MLKTEIEQQTAVLQIMRIAYALIVMMLLPALSRSAEGDEVSTVVLGSVAEHLPAGVAPLTQMEGTEVTRMIRALQLASYYPIEVPAAKSAGSKVVADASSSASITAWSLARAGLSGVIESIGHGAELLPEESARSQKPASPWISARKLDRSV